MAFIAAARDKKPYFVVFLPNLPTQSYFQYVEEVNLEKRSRVQRIVAVSRRLVRYAGYLSRPWLEPGTEAPLTPESIKKRITEARNRTRR